MKTIYWINGAYGVGKSTIAECLKKKLTCHYNKKLVIKKRSGTEVENTDLSF